MNNGTFQDEWLVRLLAGKSVLSPASVERLRKSEAAYASTALLDQAVVDRDSIARAVTEQYGIRFAHPEASSIDKMAIALLPEDFCRRNEMAPLRVEGDTLEVLMANPLDVVALDAATSLAGRKTVPVFGLPEKVQELLIAAYNSDSVVMDLLNKIPESGTVEWLGGESDAAEPANVTVAINAPVIKLVNSIITQAFRRRASDIHIEHDERLTNVRYRVDGVLKNFVAMPRHVGEGPLVSRIKIMASLDVADRRRPQDGRAKLRVGKDEVVLRVSTLPTQFGEKVVLRLLYGQAHHALAELGFRPAMLERLVSISSRPQGMMLVTGPTGCGKTTTLYSILHRIQSPDINITTVEDPIEYRLDGINQVQVNEKAGLVFSAVLRSVLRQDPDVVLVGEIRDRETADIAFQAALTGHMVFSTLHTNGALESVTRLLDMGVERYRLAPALSGILAQRLVRRNCPHCRVPANVDPFIAERQRLAGLKPGAFRGEGCERCGFSGLSGRTTVGELLDLTDQSLRDLINERAEESVLREEALRRGLLITMEQDALAQISDGTVPVVEAAEYIRRDDKAGPRAEAAPPAESPQRSAQAPAPAPVAARKRKILIVDDYEDNRAVARGAFEKESEYELSEAATGVEAMQKIAQDPPDLVVLDLMMPEMNGLTLIKRLREELGLVELPIIVVTAISEEESQTTTLEIGADDYLTKPFRPSVLRARIQALFRRLDARAAAPKAAS